MVRKFEVAVTCFRLMFVVKVFKVSFVRGSGHGRKTRTDSGENFLVRVGVRNSVPGGLRSGRKLRWNLLEDKLLEVSDRDGH